MAVHSPVLFAKKGRKKKINSLPLRLQLFTDINLPLLVPFLPLGYLPSSWLRSPATDSTHPPFTSSWLSLSSLRLCRHPKRARHSPDLVLMVHSAPSGSSTSLHPSTTTLLSTAWSLGQPSKPDSPVQPLLYITPLFPLWLANCERALWPFCWLIQILLTLMWKWGGATEVQLWFLLPDIAPWIIRNCAR